MASASYWDPNWAQKRRMELDAANRNLDADRNAMLAALRGNPAVAPTLSSVEPVDSGGFGAQQSAMDRLFQLKQQEALSAVAKRADQLAAARGMHIDGGQSIQMEQELSNEALGQLNQQQLGANADIEQQRRAYALRQQEMAMRQQQMAEQRRQFDAELKAQEQDRAWEKQQKERLYQDMRNAGTSMSAQAQARNPFNTTMSLFQDGKSGTGSISGGPAMGSGWDTRIGSERGLWDAPKAPTYSSDNYETKEQAAARQAANPRSGFDYSGAKNTGGQQVAGVSPAGNPTSTSLTSQFASNFIKSGGSSRK